jgi:aminoglycoside phosphotransferase (APT) family kinase protein
MVCTWLTGTPLPPGGGLGAADVDTLAEFVLALQALETNGGPEVAPGQRAGPVAAYDGVVRAALDETSALQAAGRIEPDLVDEQEAASVWRTAVEVAPWQGPGVWVHRDLQGGNLLTVDGRLSGVLDFGGLAVGDPAGDVMAAFHVFSAESVEISGGGGLRRCNLGTRTRLGPEPGPRGAALLPRHAPRDGRYGTPGHPGNT